MPASETEQLSFPIISPFDSTTNSSVHCPLSPTRPRKRKNHTQVVFPYPRCFHSERRDTALPLPRFGLLVGHWDGKIRTIAPARIFVLLNRSTRRLSLSIFLSFNARFRGSRSPGLTAQPPIPHPWHPLGGLRCPRRPIASTRPDALPADRRVQSRTLVRSKDTERELVGRPRFHACASIPPGGG